MYRGEGSIGPYYVRGQKVEYIDRRGKLCKGVVQRIEAAWPSYMPRHSEPDVTYEIKPDVRTFERVIVKQADIRTPPCYDHDPEYIPEFEE